MANLPGIVGAVLLGLTMSQFPEFTQQYQQRLGGAVDELRTITEEFDGSAADQGLTRDAALAEYTGSAFLIARAKELDRIFIRYDRLSADLVALENSTALTRLANLPRMTDRQLAARTWLAYKPAVPVSPEGLTFTTIGALVGYTLIAAFFGLFRRRRKIA